MCQLLKILSIFLSPPEAKQCGKACAVAVPAVTYTCMLALEQTWFWQLTAYLQPLPNAQSRSWNVGKCGECTARHVGWGLSRVLRLLLTLVIFKHLLLLSMTNWMHYPSSWEKASGGLNKSVAAYHIYFSLSASVIWFSFWSFTESSLDLCLAVIMHMMWREPCWWEYFVAWWQGSFCTRRCEGQCTPKQISVSSFHWLME